MTRAKKWGLWLLQFGAGAAVTTAFGQWQYHRGFDKGADAAICAFAVAMDGEQAVQNYDACKRAGRTDWIIEGFDPHGKKEPTA